MPDIRPLQPRSDLAIPPGELLAEEIEARGMLQRDLAALMGRQPNVVSEIVRGRKAITPRTALQLERALGIDAGSGSTSRRSTASRSRGARWRKRRPEAAAAAHGGPLPHTAPRTLRRSHRSRDS